MPLNIAFSKTPKNKADTMIVGVYEDKRLSAAAENLDKELDGFIAHHLENQKKFKGNLGQTLTLSAPKKSAYYRIILFGYGQPEELTHKDAELIGGKLYLAVSSSDASSIALTVTPDQAREKIQASTLAAHIALGFALRNYKFDKYRGSNDDENDENTIAFEIFGDVAENAKEEYEILQPEIDGVFFARDLVNEPANKLYPESFAQIVKEELRPLGVEVEIIDDKKMQKLGFKAHMEVGKGSIRPPCVVIMKWRGSGQKDFKDPLAFVGKGVTFDTGGVNLKPNGSIEDMKLDMAGAAAVVGLMKTLALRKSKSDVVGIIGLAENMNSHMAYRPGDIIDSLSGKTIEVLNTDAEGRLVLADALTYVQDTYSPRIIVDLATLTGAMMVALGFEYCGTFVNNDELWQKMEKASYDSTEKLWRMPLDEAYRKEMDSKIADIKNLATSGRYAGACTAAGFLERFVDEGRAWAHMDIAGTSWVKADRPTAPKPATGFGVRVLNRLVQSYEIS